MAGSLLPIVVFLQTEGPGRSDAPSGAGGVLILIGIAVVVALVAIGALYLVVRSFRARRAADRSGETVRRPTASEQGRPWSSER